MIIFDIGIDLRKQKLINIKKSNLKIGKNIKNSIADNFIGLFDRLTPDAVL